MRSRVIPRPLLDALESAYRSGGDLREAVAPIVAMLHGSRRSYVDGCRCAECTAANTAYQLARRPERAERLAANPDLQPHGVRSTYTNYGCRCEPCRKANSEGLAAEQAERTARLVANPTIRPHGDKNTYTAWGCRCAECRVAMAAYNRERYAKRKADQ